MPINPIPPTPVERSLTITPPVKGWNTRDPKSNMDPEYALELENFFPTNGKIELRDGYRMFASGMAASNAGDIVTGLGSYGRDFMIAVATTAAMARNVYSISPAGVVANITGAAVLTTSDIISLNFNGYFFFKPLNTSLSTYKWNNTGNIVASGFVGPFGGDSDFTYITSYKKRFYGAQFVSPTLWYGEPLATSGTMLSFPLASLLTRGGYLSIIGQVSRVKNYLEDSLFVAITTEGECLIYEGDYPNASNWRQIGHYFMPPPLASTAAVASGGDLIVGTKIGAISIMRLMAGENAFAEGASISSAISDAWADIVVSIPAATTSGRSYAVEYPNGGYLLFNIPITADTTSHQFVMNIKTGAWCKFTGQNAFCWTVFRDELYFGGTHGKVFKADSGFFDENPASVGAALSRTIKCRYAFNYFGSPSKRKKFTQAIPTVYQSEGLSITSNIDVDYTDTTATSEETDTSKGTDFQIYQPRVGLVASSGNAGSYRIDGTVTTKRFTVEATKIFWNEGGDF